MPVKLAWWQLEGNSVTELIDVNGLGPTRWRQKPEPHRREKALEPDAAKLRSHVVSVDAIVVLGCRIAPDGKPVGASSRRVLAALGVYRQGLAPWVVASGGKRWHGVAEAEAYREILVAGRIPEHHVLMELASMTTRQNAFYVADLFRLRGWKRAAVVTCEWHMARALRCFADAGLDAEAVPVRSPARSPVVRVYRKLRELTSYYADRGSGLGR